MPPAGNIACSLNLADSLLQCLGKPVLRRTWFTADHVVEHNEVITRRSSDETNLPGHRCRGALEDRAWKTRRRCMWSSPMMPSGIRS